MKTLLLFLIILFELTAQPISKIEFMTQNQKYFVIWNIGQGLWTTAIEDNSCWHFDYGTEKKAPVKLIALCQHKLNILMLSHWDWDHRSGLYDLIKNNFQICYLAWPVRTQNKPLPKGYKDIPICSQLNSSYEKIDFDTIYSPQQKKNKTSNENSRVFLLKKTFLLPGDSDQKAEEQWRKNSLINQTKILILGHHGSRTSTSENLLSQLPLLKTAIASSRFQKYHHPHQEVLLRLKKRKTPVLKTEDWGSIIFQL